MDNRATTFQRYRPKLYGIAYRMLGSKADAEDMLQEAYLRWHQTDAGRVRIPEAWLTTTVTRLCIDRLRAARTEREAYVGPWLPEPLVGDESQAPDRSTELASDLSVAFMVVLERLSPEERAAFLLHEVFECDYDEIARILGKTEVNCRQIVHRSREHVRQDRPRFRVSELAHRQLLERFVAAARSADRGALQSLFAVDAVWTADGGGKTSAATKAVQGSTRIAKLVAGFSRQLALRYGERMMYRLMPINGQTGIVAYVDGEPTMALSMDTDGVRILAAYNVLNPEKLQRIARSPFDA